MDIATKKKALDDEFKENMNKISLLVERQSFLKGQYQLLLDLEQENKQNEPQQPVSEPK